MITKKQIAFISGAVALLVLLYLLPKTPSAEVMAKAPSLPKAPVAEYNMSSYIDSVLHSLPADKAEQLKEQEIAGNLDSASSLWLSFKDAGISAYVLSQKATKSRNKNDWEKAGERFYLASRFASEKQRPYYFSQAIESFNKVLDQDPKNFDARTNLGICYVEGSAEPMKGITLLREVVAEDSMQMNAQVNLALFAIQSGQYDKAIDRFNKILSMKPDYLEAYIYLGQTYASKGEKPKAIESLEKYIKLSKDETINAEINKYITELKNS